MRRNKDISLILWELSESRQLPTIYTECLQPGRSHLPAPTSGVATIFQWGPLAFSWWGSQFFLCPFCSTLTNDFVCVWHRGGGGGGGVLGIVRWGTSSHSYAPASNLGKVFSKLLQFKPKGSMSRKWRLPHLWPRKEDAALDQTIDFQALIQSACNTNSMVVVNDTRQQRTLGTVWAKWYSIRDSCIRIPVGVMYIMQEILIDWLIDWTGRNATVSCRPILKGVKGN